MNRLARMLLGVSAAILAVGGLMHARAYGRASDAVASSNLPDFYAGSLKALWLIDSATLIVLAMTFAVVALRPAMVAGVVVVLLALVPAATAVLLYNFIGMFLPAHLLMAAAIMAAFAGLSSRRS